ncbi:HesB/YadR/YfhF family protein [Paraliobacillus ryukyuensis]|uniref:HesB/YadR/YfhF family protein n=1 Tax=Paraliobacillus ryukyuensis TaxID=200904 RepID=UPI0009A69AE6|nr:hypothetical protein [Paraliobacillus ryukyuensis]
MAMHMTEEAAKWYQEEMDLESGDYVHFYVKLYGGIPTAHPNYFLGVSIGKDGEMSHYQTFDGVTFYFSEQDAWFLNQYDLAIKMGKEEAVFEFTPINNDNAK